MTLAEVVVRDTDGGIHRYTPLTAKVTLHGIKRADTAKFTFPISATVKKDYEISYIQDIVDVNYLTAVWNFQLSLLDEGGFNLDGDDIPESRFVPVTTPNKKMAGNYALAFKGANQGVSIENTTEMQRRIDFSKQFDIFVWVTPFTDSGTNAIFFSKYNSAGGIEIGFTRSDRVNPGHVCLRVNNGSRTEKYVGTSIPIQGRGDENDSPAITYLVRCWRDGDNVIRVSVNGQVDIEETIPDSLGSTSDLRFGSRETSATFRGLLHQVRIYSGATLSDGRADRIYLSRPQPFTMKFGGTVINVNDSTAKKTVVARSFATSLYTKSLTDDLYTAAGTSSIREGNTYTETTDLKPVLVDMLSVVQSGLTLKTIRPFTSPATQVIGVGNVIDFLNITMTITNNLFYVTPRKLLIVEDEDGISTSHTFKQGGTGKIKYRITESEERTFNRTSGVTVIGHNKVTEHSGRNVDINKSLTIYAPQLVGVEAISDLAQSLNTFLRFQPDRYVIDAPVLVNHIRPLHRVTISNTIKFPTDINTTISEITFMYPKAKTTIHVGINPIDYYDYEAEKDQQVVGLSNAFVTDTSTTTPPDEVGNDPPVVMITEPSTGHSTSNPSVRLVGTATDPEDGNIASSIVWRSSRDGALGTGSAISEDLSVGTHNITATVTDSGGLMDIASITVTITASLPPAPSSFVAALSGLRVSLSWSSVSTATSYNIYRQVGSLSFMLLNTSTTTSYTDNLSSDETGTTVSYYVTAENSAGESPASQTRSVEVASLPAAPRTVFGFTPGTIPNDELVVQIETNRDVDEIDLHQLIDGEYIVIESAKTESNDDREKINADYNTNPPLQEDDGELIYILVENLDPATLYHFRAYSRNSAGLRSATFEDGSGQTKA